MNETIQLLKNHRSIRKFTTDRIPDQELEQILLSAQAASTSSNIQAYSVVAVTDPLRKKRLADLAGNQKHIEESPILLIWCADLNKIRVATQLHVDDELHQNVETFLLGTIDATLAAQNAVIAAESLGYGIVYIGGIRNHPKEVTELLELPLLVYPVFGLCIGVPDQEPDIRPRLPLTAIFHEEVYRQDRIVEDIEEYDAITQHYYSIRKVSGHGRNQDTKWSKEMVKRFSPERSREHLHDFLHDQGFEFR